MNLVTLHFQIQLNNYAMDEHYYKCLGRGISSAADATLEFSPSFRGGTQAYLGTGLTCDLGKLNERIRINICGQIFETSVNNIR